MFTLNKITKNEELNYFVSSLPCPNCDSVLSLEITPDKLYAYNQGAYAQDVLSAYDADTRERFITGICGTCWNEMFGEPDWDDE
tara:strand:- start:335 stop:586 length:252 start_codon:yes stop_codon:yes gene_type:complete